MGRKKGKPSPGSSGQPPRRGKRRSIRYEAVSEWPEDRQAARASDAPPAILLRKLTLDEAISRLEAQLRAHAGQGHREVLVVHGKGSNSPGGISLLGPAVRQWCNSHRDLVAACSDAPGKWGGAGAVVVTLRV